MGSILCLDSTLVLTLLIGVQWDALPQYLLQGLGERALHLAWAKQQSWPWWCACRFAGPKDLKSGELALLAAACYIG